jgi:hypothetical protein
MGCIRDGHKRLVAFIVLAMLLYAQVSLPAHAALHYDHMHDISASECEHGHEYGHGHENEHDPHSCPECFVFASFKAALSVDGSYEARIFPAERPCDSSVTQSAGIWFDASYEARAPPVLSV